MQHAAKAQPFPRGAGVLLPVSSLPSRYGIGTFGREAFRFIDFLKRAGQRYWQVLPVGPTGFGDSPYQSFSAFAGNPYLIDLDTLVREGLLTREEIGTCDWGGDPGSVDYAKIFQSRFRVLRFAFRKSSSVDTEEYRAFCGENDYWLEDYALFMALKFRFENRSWQEWPEEIRFRRPEALERYGEELRADIDFWKFCQFKFFEQWSRVKEYANRSGIRIMGDIPIYAALDSADVWSHGDLFQLDEARRPIKVAGVPPDAFSKDGQLWGNPLYDWDATERDGFDWWKKRMAHSAGIYDVIRIDHFIGMVRYFAIPYGSATAAGGRWMQGPGKKLTDAIDSAVGGARVVAEDLGVVVPEVRELLRQTGYPGMKVLQFAFDSNPQNEYLPHCYTRNTVVYGGTHDNDTLVSYAGTLKRKEARYAKAYLGVKRRKELPVAMIRAGYASVADTVIFQAQDLLLLPGSARMNFPSTIGGNWKWRLQSRQLTDDLADRLNRMAEIYGRA
jgi:4-alpha-glucanotransferase